MKPQQQRTNIDIPPLLPRFDYEQVIVSVRGDGKVTLLFSKTHAIAMDVKDMSDIKLGSGLTPVMELNMTHEQLKTLRDLITERLQAFEERGL